MSGDLPVIEPIVKLFEKTYDDEPSCIGQAPGRIEFIGNHTDYNGGLVLGAAIDRYIQVAVRSRNDGAFHFTSSEGRTVTLERCEFQPQNRDKAWVNYPLGVLIELEKAGMPPLAGLELAVVSDLPSGSGLSSSAALEMATAKALLELSGHQLSLIETVRAARRAENEFVGVPCGILDQGVSGFGRSGHLVMIDCATEDFSTLPLPANMHFWILNSNEKHSLVDSLYAKRFDECREALRQVRAQGCKVTSLAELSPEAYATVRAKLPDVLRRRADHIVEENHRVAQCRDLLRGGGSPKAVGALLDASHRSSSELFENSTPALDLLVKLAHGRSGVYGARLTGGGFGGAVMLFTDERFTRADADAIVGDYLAERKDSSRPAVFHVRPGDGASGRQLSAAQSGSA